MQFCVTALPYAFGRSAPMTRLVGHFDRLSSDSRYQRFFGFRNALTLRELSCFTEPDFLRHVALVATINEGNGLVSIVGDGRCVALPDCRYAAELALSIVDAYQRRGIGTLLLEHLTRLARHGGVRRLEADVMGSNRGALRFLIRRGFKSSGTSGGVCSVALSIEDHDVGPGPYRGPAHLLDTVRQRAHQLYLAREGKHGKDLEDWLAAECELHVVSSPNWPGSGLQNDEEVPAGE
jgi:GNAT superfamily N-acetyltransferase